MDEREASAVYPLADSAAPSSATDLVLPFEFIIQGPPFSAQTHNRRALRAWKNSVQKAAQSRLPPNPKLLAGKLWMKVAFYHDGPEAKLDRDNMLKPIQDALNGVVYEDDSQLIDTAIRATSIDGAFKVRGMSVTLAEGFCLGNEFLHVIIDHVPDHQELLR